MSSDTAAELPQGEPSEMAAKLPEAGQPWVTTIVVSASVVVFVGTQFSETAHVIHEWLAPSAISIWEGAYWGPLSSVLVHFEVWHLVGNLYWLWLLGSAMERYVGSMHYLAFLLTAGFVSSSFQLALSDTTGVGASGVVYAIFGFLILPNRRRHLFAPRYWQTVEILFVVWLFACLAITYSGAMEIGNTAHFSGLLFGFLLGGYQANPNRRGMFALSVFMFLASFVPLFWHPWSITWMSHLAYQAHADFHFDQAIRGYDQILKRDPKNAWAYQNRSAAHRSLGNQAQADADFARAIELNPKLAIPAK